jgi:hypothetical protein
MAYVKLPIPSHSSVLMLPFGSKSRKMYLKYGVSCDLLPCWLHISHLEHRVSQLPYELYVKKSSWFLDDDKCDGPKWTLLKRTVHISARSLFSLFTLKVQTARFYKILADQCTTLWCHCLRMEMELLIKVGAAAI